MPKPVPDALGGAHDIESLSLPDLHGLQSAAISRYTGLTADATAELKQAANKTAVQLTALLLERLASERREFFSARQAHDDVASLIAPTLDSQTIKATQLAQRHEAMKALAFPSAEPSADAFRQYLRTLRTRTDVPFEEKKGIVEAVNYWKHELGGQLLFQDRPCVLALKRSERGRGGFRLSTTGKNAQEIYSRVKFPNLDFREDKVAK